MLPHVDHTYRLRANDEAVEWLRSTHCAAEDCDCATCMMAHAYLNVYDDISDQQPKASSDEREGWGNGPPFDCAFCHSPATRFVDGTTMCGRCERVYLSTVGEEQVMVDFETGKPFTGDV